MDRVDLVTDRPSFPLPPAELRAGGRHFTEDDDFVRSAARDAKRLRKAALLQASSRVVDWGCGAGRLLYGLREELGEVADYIGIDVRADDIDWANENLADDRSRFVHVDTPNARYNVSGTDAPALPLPDGQTDVFYGYSVLSHMIPDDIRAYTAEMHRVLTPKGRAFVTAFVEEDVPLWDENPEGYGPLDWRGPLHCVRFERRFFETMLADAGLQVQIYEYGRETDGQSLYVVARRA
jgi:SAM-dependent methyltransferase